MAIHRVPPTDRPRNFLARKEQTRLLLLVMSLGLAVMVAIKAADPDTWRWLEAMAQNSEDPSSQRESGEGEAVDTRLRPASEDRIPGTLRNPMPIGEEEAAPVVAPGRYFPGVRPEYLREIKDNTFFSAPESGETKAWYNLLGVLDRADLDKLETASTGPVRFVQIFRQPNEYRGELVTLKGTLVQALRTSVGTKNDEGITTYYKTLLMPADSPTQLIIVYLLKLPEGFPTGEKISETVELTGFFFKRWAYKAKDSVRLAPVVLAREPRWKKKPPPAEAPSMSATAVGAVVFTAAVLCAVVMLVIRRRWQHVEVSPRPRPDSIKTWENPTETQP